MGLEKIYQNGIVSHNSAHFGNIFVYFLRKKHQIIQFQSSYISVYKFWGAFLNPLTTNVPHQMGTSQLIYNTNQLTGFYMMGNVGYQWVKITFFEKKCNVVDQNHWLSAL